MSGLNEIKQSIENVKSTQKITRAMYLIAASKSKSARAKLEKTRLHFNQIAITLSEIIAETDDLDTPYIKDPLGTSRSDKNLYLVLAGDKGQAGGYNHNIVKLLEQSNTRKDDVYWVAGFVGRRLITQKGYNVSPGFTFPVINPNLYRARDVSELVVDAYMKGEANRVYLVYTDMVTALKLEPRLVQLLPLKPEDFTHKSPDVGPYDKAVYEPSPEAVFDHLAPHYLKGVIYGAFVNSFTSEQNARMFAMDNATNNAAELIANLTLQYNRSRQAQITREINEITGGIPLQPPTQPKG